MKKIFYRVEKGDTLFLISHKLKTPTTKIIEQNNLEREIEEGDLLVILPPKETYKAELGDTMATVAKKFSISENHLKEMNKTDYIYFSQIIAVKE